MIHGPRPSDAPPTAFDDAPGMRPPALLELAAELDLGVEQDLGVWVYDHLGERADRATAPPRDPTDRVDVHWFLWAREHDRLRWSSPRPEPEPVGAALIRTVHHALASGRLEIGGHLADPDEQASDGFVLARRVESPPHGEYVIGCWLGPAHRGASGPG